MNFSAFAAILVALLAAGLAYRRLIHPRRGGPDPVNRLWRAVLKPAGESAYGATVAEVDCAFVMLSVTLDDALSARKEDPEQARRLSEMSLELLRRFLNALGSLVQVTTQVSRRLHRLPPVRPLAVENFRSASAIALARRQALLHRILLSSRMRFLQKLDGIARAAEQLAAEYEEAVARVLTAGAHSTPAWQTLDHAHFDLNTLWRETQIVLKSVLHLTPDELVRILPAQFQAEFARREAVERPAPKPSQSRSA